MNGSEKNKRGGDGGASNDVARGDTNEKDNVDAKGEGGDKVAASHNSPLDLNAILEKDSPDLFLYNMNHAKRGKAIIFNNKTFKPGLGERKGTDVDASRCVKAAGMDHSENDAFVMVILSHGCKEGIHGSDNVVVSVDTIISPFKEDKCPTLIGKPKLFFIQACRGTDFDSGVVVEADADVEENHSIPSDAENMLIAYSVVPGYFSWRNMAKGSWFMQSLCKVLGEYGEKKEILWMMTRVNAGVAFDFQSNTGVKVSHGKKQIPAITSMLTKELYFRPK